MGLAHARSRSTGEPDPHDLFKGLLPGNRHSIGWAAAFAQDLDLEILGRANTTTRLPGERKKAYVASGSFFRMALQGLRCN